MNSFIGLKDLDIKRKMQGQAMLESLVLLPSLIFILGLTATVTGRLAWSLIIAYELREAELCAQEFKKLKFVDLEAQAPHPCFKGNLNLESFWRSRTKHSNKDNNQ